VSSVKEGLLTYP